jgi:hypothetical protein
MEKPTSGFQSCPWSKRDICLDFSPPHYLTIVAQATADRAQKTEEGPWARMARTR